MSIFPSDDTFAEGANHYGERLGSYLRHRPWVSGGDTATPYAITNTVADLHDGYSTSSRLASFRSQSASGSSAPLGAVLWRQVYALDTKVALSFRAQSIAGATSDDFRWVGVCSRVSGGAYTDTAGQQSIRDTSGYWFMLCHTPGISGADTRWEFLRVNAGVITILKEVSGASADAALAAAMSGFHEIELMVDDVSGNPVLTAYYDGTLIDSATDSSGSKITTAGRCGFGMVRDRQISAVKIATIASYFRVTDLSIGQVVLADRFDRVNKDCNPSVTDGNSVSGRVLMSMWTLDIHGVDAWTQGSTQKRDPGLNRIQAEDGIFNFSQIPASDQYTQARSIVFRKT